MLLTGAIIRAGNIAGIDADRRSVGSEVWALVGVVIGVILGGAAQILADSLRRRHEKRSILRAERREAYTEFLAATTAGLEGAVVLQAEYRSMFGKEETAAAKSPERQPVPSVLFDSGREGFNRLAIALSRVELIAPNDTFQAAQLVHLAVMGYLFKDEHGMAEELVQRNMEFARLAKRDLA